MSMIEKVAKAIGESYDGLADPVLTPNNYARALSAARAAIEAMQEPTDAMCSAGAEYYHDNFRPGHEREDTNVVNFWRDMISAALKED